VYLGQDVPIEDLIRMVAREHPALVCMSANSHNTALLLREVQQQLAKIDPPTPLFAYGGRSFDTDPDLRRLTPGHYLGADPRDAVNTINNLIRTQRHI
jgi:methanogenic corrinoid protein MtbC1